MKELKTWPNVDEPLGPLLLLSSHCLSGVLADCLLKVSVREVS